MVLFKLLLTQFIYLFFFFFNFLSLVLFLVTKTLLNLEKYNLGLKFQIAKEVTKIKAHEMDEKYKVSESITDFDRKHEISSKVKSGVKTASSAVQNATDKVNWILVISQKKKKWFN